MVFGSFTKNYNNKYYGNFFNKLNTNKVLTLFTNQIFFNRIILIQKFDIKAISSLNQISINQEFGLTKQFSLSEVMKALLSIQSCSSSFNFIKFISLTSNWKRAVSQCVGTRGSCQVNIN